MSQVPRVALRLGNSWPRLEERPFLKVRSVCAHSHAQMGMTYCRLSTPNPHWSATGVEPGQGEERTFSLPLWKTDVFGQQDVSWVTLLPAQWDLLKNQCAGPVAEPGFIPHHGSVGAF